MSDNRSMIAESVGKIFAQQMSPAILAAAEEGRWPDALWQEVEAAGFIDVLKPEGDGGTGGGWADAYPVLHALGYARVPLPVAETLVGNGLLAQAGIGSEPGACALVQQRPGDNLRLTIEGGQLRLDGQSNGIPWARQAGRLVVAGRVGDRAVIGVARMPDPGVVIINGRSIAAEPLDAIAFDNCRCAEFAEVTGALAGDPLLVGGALARAVQMAGALQWVLEQTVRHATERQQFGRPLAGFQAVKQVLAVIATEVAAASMAAEVACEAMTKRDARFEVAVAKIRTGQAVAIACMNAHQVHGAMGFTYEHTLHFATRRLWSWRADYGNEAHWAQEIGRAAIARGGDAFWQDLTAA